MVVFKDFLSIVSHNTIGVFLPECGGYIVDTKNNIEKRLKSYWDFYVFEIGFSIFGDTIIFQIYLKKNRII